MSRDPFSSEPQRGDPLDQNLTVDRSGTSFREVAAFAGEAELSRPSETRLRGETTVPLRARHQRDRARRLRESELETLSEIGKFRVVDAADLSEYGYAGNVRRMHRDLRHLERQGLIAVKKIWSERHGTSHLLVLTRKAKRLVLQSGRLPRGQVIYHGLVKPREAKHDAALYKLYQREKARIESAGGRPLGVALDYELMRDLYRELARLGVAADARKAREVVAEKHGLVVINDKVQIPDLRLEYETADHERRRLDLELATRNYRPRSMAEKVKAGFSIYAPREDASKLRRILEETELTARILSL